MNIGVACGGTGGHIFPGLATARELRARGHHVALWLAGKSVEAAAVEGWDGPIVTAQSEGFEHGVSLRSLRTIWKLFRAISACSGAMKKNPPDVMLAMGSYACVGPLGAALRRHVPYVLHEANVVPGRTVQLFSRKAAAVAACFEETAYHLKRRDIVLTGMPLRASLAEAASASRQSAVRPDPFTILVMGGSGGARRLNEIVPKALVELSKTGATFRVVHLTGKKDEEFARERYQRSGFPAEVRGFTHDMPSLYARTSLAICRSGAATCAELSAFGLPSLLVPYPFAVRNHQMANARAMEKAGAADVISDANLSTAWLVSYLQEQIAHPERLEKMRSSAQARGRVNGAALLADLLEACGRAHGPGCSTDR